MRVDVGCMDGLVDRLVLVEGFVYLSFGGPGFGRNFVT
jgi:hypothetical protein